MIGRAAVSNPFLPAIIKAGKDEFTNKVGIFKNFYEDLFEGYQQMLSGPGHLLDRMKGFWTYFSQSFAEGNKIRKRIMTVVMIVFLSIALSKLIHIIIIYLHGSVYFAGLLSFV